MTWRENRVLGLTYGELTWFVVGLLILLPYEIWAALTGDGDVLTRAWRANALRWIMLPFGSGILMGHLNGPALPYWWRFSWTIWAALFALSVVWGLAVRTPVHEEYRFPLFILGVAVGAITWAGRP